MTLKINLWVIKVNHYVLHLSLQIQVILELLPEPPLRHHLFIPMKTSDSYKRCVYFLRMKTCNQESQNSEQLTIVSSFERQKIFAVTSSINWSQFCLRILFWGQILNCGTMYAVWIFLLFNTYDQTPVLMPTGAIA